MIFLPLGARSRANDPLYPYFSSSHADGCVQPAAA